MKAFQIAVKAALSTYAESLGVSIQEAVELYRTSETTRDCIQLLVLAQADRSKLQELAKQFAA